MEGLKSLVGELDRPANVRTCYATGPHLLTDWSALSRHRCIDTFDKTVRAAGKVVLPRGSAVRNALHIDSVGCMGTVGQPCPRLREHGQPDTGRRLQQRSRHLLATGRTASPIKMRSSRRCGRRRYCMRKSRSHPGVQMDRGAISILASMVMIVALTAPCWRSESPWCAES